LIRESGFDFSDEDLTFLMNTMHTPVEICFFEICLSYVRILQVI